MDPWEMHNLADDPKRAKAIATLDEKLETLKNEFSDPMKFESLK